MEKFLPLTEGDGLRPVGDHRNSSYTTQVRQPLSLTPVARGFVSVALTNLNIYGMKGYSSLRVYSLSQGEC
jgi:hypothetical protein